MKHSKAFKYRFYPSPEQKQLLSRTFGCVRVVWNNILCWRQEEFAAGNKPNYGKTSTRLTELKQDESFSWLNDVSSVALQQTLRNQDVAYKNFFAKRTKFPKFKRKSNSQSFKLMSNGYQLKDGKLFIAKCKEPIVVKFHRLLAGTHSSITISKDASDRYFVSFTSEVEIEALPTINKTIGIDLGLTDFIVTSDGEKVKPLKALIKYQVKLAILQRRLSRKTKGSINRNKARLKVARQHSKIVDCRKDFIHKLSKRLINENQVICLEDLNVTGMMKNHCLAKAIVDASWSEFNRQLEYKAKWYGRTIAYADRWYPSSQLCSACGINSGKKPLNIRSWTCSCGAVHDRDINAAINIRTAGLAGLARGAASVRITKTKVKAVRHAAKKQEGSAPKGWTRSHNEYKELA